MIEYATQCRSRISLERLKKITQKSFRLASPRQSFKPIISQKNRIVIFRPIHIVCDASLYFNRTGLPFYYKVFNLLYNYFQHKKYEKVRNAGKTGPIIFKIGPSRGKNSASSFDRFTAG